MQKTDVSCLKYNCIKCCINTNMILTNEDVIRINKLGFNNEYFLEKKDGWKQLKNIDGKCIFHNGYICTIYNYRPEGCRFYPIVFNKDDQLAILDKDCPYKNNFKISKITKNRIKNLVRILEHERLLLQKSKNNKKIK